MMIIKVAICFLYFFITIGFWLYEFYEIPRNKIVRKRMLIQALDWCILNIKKEGRATSPPKLVVRNHDKGEVLGTYNYYSKTITIFINRHNSLKSIIDTLIHEYVHHIQLKSNDDNKLYDKLTAIDSYWNNSFEIEARNYAKAYRLKCIMHLQRDFLCRELTFDTI